VHVLRKIRVYTCAKEILLARWGSKCSYHAGTFLLGLFTVPI
jgi:hypothetical protein